MITPRHGSHSDAELYCYPYSYRPTEFSIASSIISSSNRGCQNVSSGFCTPQRFLFFFHVLFIWGEKLQQALSFLFLVLANIMNERSDINNNHMCSEDR